MNASGAGRIEELLDKAATLAERLGKGRSVIRAEEEQGGERADYYFERWLSLLTDYEQTVDELRRLGAPEERIRSAGGGHGT
ncbi:MAG: hypothetical protein HPY83_13020 [Anaerolineae bacterium]|nr:hypothetical protein [Anaerolineae bacterium]